VKIFWSWQSDTPGKTGRHFVRVALHEVVDEIKQSLEVEEPSEREARAELHLDHDRKGVAGSPDLARLILEKIEDSAVFIADVTPVGFVHEAPQDRNSNVVKKIINPNVAIELGYALHVLTDRAFLMVMNEFYGSRTDLPFDLQSKAGPITFNLPPDANRQVMEAERRSLKSKLLEAVKLCLAQRPEPSLPQQQPFAEAKAARPPALYFEPGEVLANFGHPGEQEHRLDSEQVAYIRLFPTYAQPPVGLAKVADAFATRKPCPMSMVVGGLSARNRYGPIIIDPLAATSIAGLTQGFASGELWGLNGKVFVPQQLQRGFPPRPEMVTVIPMIAFEKLHARVLLNYVTVAVSEFKLQLPYTVEFGAIGLKDACLAVPGPYGQGEIIGPVLESSIASRHSVEDAREASVLQVLRSYLEKFYDLAACSRAAVLTDEEIAAHRLPPR
jgi:hypothetical protein